MKKRLVAIFLVLLLSIESFAAVVSDNDGSAFITKAEFDSLKNDFQSQIDQYNTSIDSKIDGAIASYLAGIKMEKESILKLPIDESNIKNLYWFKSPKVYGTLRTWSDETTYTDKKDFVDPPKDDRFAFDGNSEMRVLGNTIGLGGGVWWALSFALNQTVAQRQNSRYYVVKDWSARTSWPSTLFLKLQDSPNYTRTRTDSNGWWRNWIYYCWTHLGSYNSEGFWRLSDNSNRGWAHPYQVGYAPSTNPAIPSVFEDKGTSDWQFLNGYIYADGNGYRNDSANTFYFITRVDARGLDLWPTWLNGNSGLMTYSGNYARNPSSWNTVEDHVPEILMNEGLHDFIFGDGTTNDYGNQIKAWNRMMLGDDSDLKINIYRQDYNNSTLDGRYRRIVEKANYTDISCYVSSVMCGSNRVAWIPNRTSTIDPGDRVTGLTIPITLHVPGNEQMKVAEVENGYAELTVGDNYLKIGQGIPIATSMNGKGDVEIKLKYTIDRMISISGTQTNLRKILVDARKKDFLTGSTTDITTYFDASVGSSTTTAKSNDLELNVASGEVATFTLHNVADEDQIWLRFKPQTTDGGYYVTIDSISAKLTTGE